MAGPRGDGWLCCSFPFPPLLHPPLPPCGFLSCFAPRPPPHPPLSSRSSLHLFYSPAAAGWLGCSAAPSLRPAGPPCARRWARVTGPAGEPGLEGLVKSSAVNSAGCLHCLLRAWVSELLNLTASESDRRSRTSGAQRVRGHSVPSQLAYSTPCIDCHRVRRRPAGRGQKICQGRGVQGTGSAGARDVGRAGARHRTRPAG